jgi:hypothetical protein
VLAFSLESITVLAKLPKSLKFQSGSDLVRLGRNHDGGYLISRDSIQRTDFLISLGINDDWSFEVDFLNTKNVPLLAFDASISKKEFLKRFLKSFTRVGKPISIPRSLRTLVSYQVFFSQPHVSHIQKFVGFQCPDENYCSMSEILSSIDSKNIFLKIDIEGAEYRILESLIEQQSRFTGLAIEFHDCDVHLSKIEEFVGRFQLELIHAHANNNSPVRPDNLLPLALELTFGKNAPVGETATLPNVLDMPCNKHKQEIALTFNE